MTKKHYTLFRVFTSTSPQDDNWIYKRWDFAYGSDDLKAVQNYKKEAIRKDPNAFLKIRSSGIELSDRLVEKNYLNENWDFDLNRFKRTDKV
jgi:hypothetical protein